MQQQGKFESERISLRLAKKQDNRITIIFSKNILSELNVLGQLAFFVLGVLSNEMMMKYVTM